MAEPPTKAALIYDFDGTLSPGSMQEHSFLPELGYADASDFWAKVQAEARRRDADPILTYMQLMLQGLCPERLSAEMLRRHGATIPFFEGVQSWFARLNQYAAEHGIALDHYVISSGIREMIEGCAIYPEFRQVFASSFAYDEAGSAAWPAVAVNYTTKVQYLFRINKGIENNWDCEAINRWVPMDRRSVPFERMIFIGDGDTDIPCMKMMRHQGGCAIAVFDQAEWELAANQDKIHRLISEDRATYVAPADFRAGSQLDVTVSGVLGRIALDAERRPSKEPSPSSRSAA